MSVLVTNCDWTFFPSSKHDARLIDVSERKKYFDGPAWFRPKQNVFKLENAFFENFVREFDLFINLFSYLFIFVRNSNF